MVTENRKYLPTLSELVDRLSIVQLKEVFIPEHKKEYAQEISDICHDIQVILNESEIVTGKHFLFSVTIFTSNRLAHFLHTIK